jgi:hypothetical protein
MFIDPVRARKGGKSFKGTHGIFFNMPARDMPVTFWKHKALVVTALIEEIPGEQRKGREDDAVEGRGMESRL